MALTFPNATRSYDAERQRIRFIGYDGMFRIEFGIEVDALDVGGQPRGEAGCLAAFDAARTRIREAASKAYKKNHQNLIVLTSSDLQ